MVVTLIAALIIGSGSRLISLRDEAARLSTATGRPITVPASMQNVMIYVSTDVPNAPTEIRAICGCLHCSSLPDHSGIALKRTKSDLAELQAERANQRRKWIEATFKEKAAFRRRQPNGSSSQQSFQEEIDRELKVWDDYAHKRTPNSPGTLSLRDLLPCEKLLETLVQRIGADELAAIPTGGIRIFETQPTLDAELLPKTGDILTIYEDEIQRIAQMRLPAPYQQKTKGWLDLDVLRPNFTVPGQLGNLRLRVFAGPREIDASLEVFDWSGRRVDGAETGFRADSQVLTVQQIVRNLPEATVLPVPQEVRDSLNFVQMSVTKRPSGWFDDPQSSEPLAILVKSLMDALAAQTPGPTVALIPDSLFRLSTQCLEGSRVNVSSFQAAVEQLEGMQHSLTSDGVQIWKTSDPEYVEQRAADRRKLKTFAAHMLEVGWVSPRIRGQLVHAGFPQKWALTDVWVLIGQMVARKIERPGGVSDSLYSLIGAISDSDWNALLSGAPRSAGQLGITRELKAVFDEDLVRSQMSNGVVSDQDKHPAELYRHSELSTTPIRLIRSEEEVATHWSNGQPETDIWVPSSKLVNLFHLSASLDEPPRILVLRDDFERDMDSRVRIRLAKREELSLEIGLPSNCRVIAQLPAIASDPGPILSYRGFPANLRDQIWQKACADAIARSRQQLTSLNAKGILPATKGITGSPPP